MQYRNISASRRVWQESGHASLCLLGVYLRRKGLFKPLEAHVKIRQKVLTYTPVQKLEMFLVAILAGAKAVSHTTITIHLDPALINAFGLPGCADQSGIPRRGVPATEQDVTDLQAALGELFGSSSQACRNDFTHQLLVLDIDLSPLPASLASEGSERGYMGRCRSGDRAQTGAGASCQLAGDRVGNGHHGAHGGESARLTRSHLRHGEPTRLGWGGRRHPEVSTAA